MLLWVSLLALQSFNKPSYFETVALGLIAAGALGWLVAAILGFARARGYGAPARWFATAASCMVIYHVHLVMVGISSTFGDLTLPLKVGAFFNLFVVLAAICAIIGFVRLTDIR